MNEFISGNVNADPQKLAQAKQYLKLLSRQFRGALNTLFVLRLISFIAGALLIIRLAVLIAVIALRSGHSHIAADALYLCILVGFKVLLSYFSDLLAGYLNAKVAAYIREQLFTDLEYQLSASPGGNTISGLSLVFGEKAAALSPYFTRYLPQMQLSVIAPVLVMGYVSWLNWVCGAMMLLALPLIPVYMILTGKGTVAASRDQWESLSKLGNYFYDRLKGVSTLMVYGRLDEEAAHVTEASASYGSLVFNVLKIAFLSAAVLDFLSTIIVAGVAVYIGLSLIGYIHFGAEVNFGLGASLTILMLVPDFLSTLKTLGTYYHDRSVALGAVLNLQEEGFLQVPPGSDRNTTKETEIPVVQDAQAGITIKGLQFGYPGRRSLFNGVDLEIAAGEKVMISGNNGSGKSTLFHLLMGFYQPDHGVIMLGGSPVTSLAEERISTIIAWQGQQPKIFSGTLRSNILMEGSAGDEEIRELIETYFDTNHFFAAFPDGLDTVITDNGRSVSGGERQKIALLRTLIRKTEILLLDEPFASLDDATCNNLAAVLVQHNPERTIILISHEQELMFPEFTKIHLHEKLATAEKLF